MKYPLVLLYHTDLSHTFDKHDFTIIKKTSTINDLNLLYSESTHLLLTCGPKKDPHIAKLLPPRLHHKWVHVNTFDDSLNDTINRQYIHYNSLPRVEIRPTFSIFTSCYKSYKKIDRAYKSILAQNFVDWEWVILDDSPEDEHFTYLRNKFKDEHRIRLYKRACNSGMIGNVKNETIGLCRGTYILEMDHDDEILPDTLKDAITVFEKHKEVGFVYMDFINIYEDGRNYKYGDFLCKGYAGYYCQKYKNKWVFVYMTPNINNVTLSHLTCCPNHPRIWRRELLNKIGSYSEYLPICDDYEILLRTCMQTKVAKICKIGYVQYMNDNNNNFSLIRNSEINRLGPVWISPRYFEKYNIDEEMKKRGAYEADKHKWFHNKIWLRKDGYEHKYDNLIINLDYKKQYLLLGLHTLDYHRVNHLYNNRENDFLLMSKELDHDKIQSEIEKRKFDKMKYYCLPHISKDEQIAYFMRLYKSCDNYEIIY